MMNDSMMKKWNEDYFVALQVTENYFENKKL